MKYRVGLVISDTYLKRKLELILLDKVVFTDIKEADIIFADRDVESGTARVFTVGRGADYALRVPFSDGEVFSLLPNEKTTSGISVIGERIFLGDEEIKLTGLELLLFMKLYRARGEFVDRKELFSVFAEGSSESMLNVYVHYLREKLERDGTRVIFSSRKHGYKIDEKFFN